MISALFLYFLLGAAILVVLILRPRHLFGNRDAPGPRRLPGGGNGGTERRMPGRQMVEALEERRKDDDVGGES